MKTKIFYYSCLILAFLMLVDMTSLSTAFLIFLSFVFYFIPTIIGEKKENVLSIFLLNFFLGWTLVGWVLALVWATSKDKKESVIFKSKKSTSEEIRELKKLLEEGTITNEQFENAKKQILNN